MKKVILDVDTGIDDALAIILAVKSGRFDIAGITTACGNVSMEQGTINTLKVLKFLGEDARIPVICGSRQPLIRQPIQDLGVHGDEGLGGSLPDIHVGLPQDGRFAADFIVDTCRQHPGEITLVLMAPLTNVALALRKEHRVSEWIHEVVIMGGAVRDVGNVTPVAEYNMYADPEAAKLVLQSGLPITLVGLDVTRKALLDESQICQIHQPGIQQLVRNITRQYMDYYYKRNGIRACVLHDPLAVAVALDKSLVQTKELYVDVETRSELCDGQTVCDFHGRTYRAPNVNVCLDVESERFMSLFLKCLNNA